MSDTIADFICDYLGRAAIVLAVLVFLVGFAAGIFAAAAYSHFTAPAAHAAQEGGGA